VSERKPPGAPGAEPRLKFRSIGEAEGLRLQSLYCLRTACWALNAKNRRASVCMMNSPNTCEACDCALRTVRAYCDPCGTRRRMVLACVPATVVEFQMRFVRSSFREAVPDVLKQCGDVSACLSLDEDTSRRICTAIADSHKQQPGLIVPGDAAVQVKVCGNCPVFADCEDEDSNA
jgi:hypothetical protein